MIQMAASKQFAAVMFQVGREVIAREGVLGLYKGLGTTVARAAVQGCRWRRTTS